MNQRNNKNRVFIAYKQDDEVTASRLAAALEQCGFSVWWDRSTLLADNWRDDIHAAIDDSACMVVLWSKASTGPAPNHVLEEAAAGSARDMLVPVMLEKVSLPAGFEQPASIDLTSWHGSTEDIFFRDLRAAVQSRLDAMPVPAAKGPRQRVLKRTAMVGLPLFAVLLAVLFNMASVQNRGCAVALFQPQLADFCGRQGWGNQPTREARLAWQALPAGDCQALLDFNQQFANSPLAELADNRYAARQTVQKEIWTAQSRTIRLAVSDEVAFSSEAFAKAAVLEKAQHETDALCRGPLDTARYKLTKSWPRIDHWDCTKLDDSFLCGGRGEAVCEIQLRGEIAQQQC